MSVSSFLWHSITFGGKVFSPSWILRLRRYSNHDVKAVKKYWLGSVDKLPCFFCDVIIYYHFLFISEVVLPLSVCTFNLRIPKREVVCFNLKHLGLISPMFYEQLLYGQIPKAKKRHWWHDYLFALLGSVPIKSACNYVGEIDPRLPKHIGFWIEKLSFKIQCSFSLVVFLKNAFVMCLNQELSQSTFGIYWAFFSF